MTVLLCIYNTLTLSFNLSCNFYLDVCYYAFRLYRLIYHITLILMYVIMPLDNFMYFKLLIICQYVLSNLRLFYDCLLVYKLS